MPSAKLELSKQQAERLNAAHSIAGTKTTDSFVVGQVFHVTVRGRSTEQLMKLATTLATISDADVKAYEDRARLKNKKPGTISKP